MDLLALDKLRLEELDAIELDVIALDETTALELTLELMLEGCKLEDEAPKELFDTTWLRLLINKDELELDTCALWLETKLALDTKLALELIRLVLATELGATDELVFAEDKLLLVDIALLRLTTLAGTELNREADEGLIEAKDETRELELGSDKEEVTLELVTTTTERLEASPPVALTEV